MESLMSLGKQALHEYQQGQGQGSHHSSQAAVTGGAHLNRPSGGYVDADGDGIPDFEQAVDHAHRESGSSGDRGLFASALSKIQGQSRKDPIDEHAATTAHSQAYENDSTRSMDASSIGMAAALQAFKKFSGGSSSGGGSSGGGSSQSALLGLAMSEASKLFEKNGGAASGSKEDAVSSAGLMVMKLLVQSKMGSTTGGSNSGGLSGLMGMASKFM